MKLRMPNAKAALWFRQASALVIGAGLRHMGVPDRRR
jgi:hypothetical protein